MSNSLYCARHFYTLNIVDKNTREYLDIEADTSLLDERDVRLFDRLA